MSKQYKIRRSVLNMTLKQWHAFPKARDVWTGTVSQWMKQIGFCGCLTAHTNEEEREFFDKLCIAEREKGGAK